MVKKLMATLLACFAMTAFAGVDVNKAIRPRSNPCKGIGTCCPPASSKPASKVLQGLGRSCRRVHGLEATTRPSCRPGVDGQRCRVLARQQQGESSVDAPLTRNRRPAVTRSPGRRPGPDST